MDFQDRTNVGGNDAVDADGVTTPETGRSTRTVVLQPDANNVVTLPEGISFDNVVAVGRDLVIEAGGVRYVIPEGAIIVPQLVVDGVTVPPLNLAALLIGNEPVPAAGPGIQSSGGNFASDPGNIQDAYGLGNLLPYTELNFPQPREEEIIPQANSKPTVIVITPNNPVGATNANAEVREAGLPARGSEPAGSDAASNSETTTGTISYSAPDGTSAVQINGVAITAVGQTFVSPDGILTITSIAEGAIGYSYTLTDNLLNRTVDGFFEVTVIDRDGDRATATLTINVIDDSPTARADSDTVAAGTYGPESGNVITGTGTTTGAAGADTLGADGASISSVSNSGGTSATPGAGGMVIAGLYGTLTLQPGGNYTYVRNPGTPGGVSDRFTYTLTDGDGSTSSAVLTINIGDSPATVISVPGLGDPGTIVDESGLPPRGSEAPGTDAPAPSETTGGSITFTAPDGPATVSINNVVITGPGQTITTPEGTLTITAYNPVTGTISYSFTLADNTAGDTTSVTFNVVVTDVDGDKDSGSFTITIIDDVPLAVNDSATQQGENSPVTVDVFANDIQGADSVQLNAIAAVAGTLSGGGTLAYNGDGTFTYTPAPGEEGTVTFDYTITDGDGDTSTATVTISLAKDSTPSISTAGGTNVDEAGLPARGSEPAGSDQASNSESATGTIAISTGGDTIASLVINGNIVTNGGTVTTAKGTLVITLDAGQYNYTYTLTDNTLADPDSDSFSLTVTDSDGDTASTTLVIAIADDTPSALDDAADVAAGTYGPVTGSVTANDTPGADDITVTSYTGAQGNGLAGSVVQGMYGKLTIDGDGNFSYTRDPGTPGGVSDTFSYVITDGDGDTATADLVISIADSTTTLDIPTSGEAGTQVLEEGLPTGSNAVGDGEFTSGTIAYTAPDGPAILTIDGVAVSSVGQTFAGTFGTLTITAISGSAVNYSYELTTNTSGDATSDSFAIVVTDVDGDASNGTLNIAIVDDVPTAVNDLSQSIAEDAPGILSGNVLTNDIQGADGANVNQVTIIVFDLPVGPGGLIVIAPAGTYTFAQNGDWTFDPNPNQDQSSGPIDASFDYQIVDGDGDVSSATQPIFVTDGAGPVGGSADALVDDDGLGGGNAASTIGDQPDANSDGDNNEATFSGTVAFTAGSDSSVTVSFANGVDGSTAMVGLETVTYSVVGNLLTATGPRGDLFTVEITNPATGAYKVTLLDNVLNADGPNDEATDALASIAFTVTDTDGSTAASTLNITFNDDAPTAVADTNSVSEGGTVGGNVLTDGIDDSFGADGPATTSPAGGVIGFDAGSNTAVAATTAPGGTLETALGFLTLNADGSYSYQSKPNSTNANTTDTFTYTIQDADGDISTQTLTITINNVAGQVSDSDILVDESGLDATGSQLVPDGEFGAGQITVTGASGTLVYSLTGSGTGTFGTLVLDPDTGAYTYVLTKAVTDTTGDDGRNTVTGAANGAEEFGYEVKDTAGNLIGSGTITINIVDDVPIARDDTPNLSIAEDASAPASLSGNVMTNDTQGADGASVTSVNIGGTNYAIAAIGTTPVVTANGSYTFDALGNWTFDPNQNLDQSGGAVNASFTYTLTDGDGDTDTATQVISITDGADPTVGGPITLTVDDQNLVDGSTPATPVQDSDDLVFTPGSDNIASIVFSTDLSALDPALTWSRVNNNTITGSDGGTLVVTLTLTVSGNTATVTATLANNFDGHPLAGDDTFDLGSIGVVATDIDGDTATGTVNISVSDDLPTVTINNAAPYALTVDESALGTAGTAELSALFTLNFNADGPAAINSVTYALGVSAPGADSGLDDVATGQNVLLRVNGSGAVEGYITDGGSGTVVFTLTVDGTGHATLTQLRAVEHGNATDPNDPTGLTGSDLITVTATVTDADGDKATTTVDLTGGLTFYDDGPSITASVIDGDTVQLITQDADTRNGGIDTAASGINFGNAFSVSASNYGADGAGNTAWSYSLVLGIAENTPTGLTSDGRAIVLITGADGSILGRTSAGAVFVVEISATGQVTLTQYAELDHSVSDTSNYASDQLPLPTGLISISGTATITDGDGDQASSTVLLDLGGNLIFQDDGPSVTTTGTAPTLTVDETVLATNASASFAANFTALFGADGAAAGTQPVYTLGVVAGASGLVDTATGQSVILSLNGTVVEGRTSGSNALVFTVTVAADGTVTLDQIRAVVHSPDTGPDQSTSLTAANLVTLTATATDYDGDTASAVLNIGNNLVFKDDGPSIDVTKGAEAGILLTTQDADTIGAASDTDTSTGNFGGVFGLTFTAGADGAATPSLSFSLSVTNAVSGLTSHGAAINLYLIGGKVVGSTAATQAGVNAGNTVFDLSVSAGGAVTLTQYSQIDHAVEGTTTAPFDDQFAILADGKIGLTASSTITDGDGDTATDSETIDLGGNVRFADHGPSITTTGTAPTLTVDETVLATNASASFAANFTALFGADGAAAGTQPVYTLGVVAGASGLVDTATGQSVILSLNGTVVEGRTSGSNALVFTVTVAADGTVTLDQIRAVVHSPDTGPDQSTSLTAANLVTLTATATDYDGDTASAVLNIGNNLVFKDDGPVALAPISASLLNAIGSSSTKALDADGNVANNYGADGPGKVYFNQNLETTSTGLTSSFAAVKYDVSADGQKLTAYTGNDPTNAASKVFTVDIIGNEYQVTMFAKLDSTQVIDFNDGGYNFTGGNKSWNGFVPNGEELGGVVNDNNSQDLLLTPKEGGVNGGTVNTTATIGGISGGASVGSSEAFRVDFVTDLRGDPADTVGGQNYAAAANRDHVFDGHYTVNGATALFKSTSGSVVRIAAYDDPDGNTIVGDGVLDTINGVTLSFKGVAYGSVIIPTSTPTNYSITAGSTTQIFTVTLNADGKTVNVAGVAGDSGSSLLGTVIGVFTADGFNSVEYTWVSGGTFQIGDFGATTLKNDPVSFSIPVEIVDGDGDAIPSGSINITANPATPPIALDLNHDGQISFMGLDAGVVYSYEVGGSAVQTAWVGADDGLLARDTGSGLDIVFTDDAVGARSDLEGLRLAFDSNGDGKLDASDAQFTQFGVWQDANSNGVVDAGEFVSLTEAGIVSINLSSDGFAYGAAGGDVLVNGTGSYTKADGSTGLLADASFATQALSAMNQRGDQFATVNAMIAALIAPEMLVAADQDLSNAMRIPAELATETLVTSPIITTMDAPSELVAVSDNFFDQPGAPHGAAASQSIGHESFDLVAFGEGANTALTNDNPLSDFTANLPAFAFDAGATTFAAPSVEGVQMMDALLALGQPQAGAGVQATDEIPALRDAFVDVADNHVVDAIVDHFANDMAGPVDGMVAHFDAGALAAVLDIGIGNGQGVFGGIAAIDLTADDMSALVASA